MRHGTSNNRRPRNRGGHGGGNRHGGGPNRSQVFDSNGPEVRIRGTAFQIQEKYMALAKDAASSGDRVLAESYLQHAEHYQRLINEWGVQAARVEQNQATDSFDRSFDPAAQNQSESSAEVQKKQGAEKSQDDLALPTSILGPKRNAKSEMTDA